jgi:hypothetical protein
MRVLDKIHEDAQKLPALQQQEVLDFIQFLLSKADRNAARQEELEWSRAALAATMLAMDEEEGENAPIYTINDAKERYE